MESSPLRKSSYKLIQLKNGMSHSYLCNNLTRSENYVAMVKNGFLNSKISIYNINELDNAVQIECKDGITWDTNDNVKECTHINYCLIN